MTEEEAKDRWCPFARCEGAYAYGNPVHNRAWDKGKVRDKDGPARKAAVLLPPASFCIGSACMAWRETQPSSFKMVPARNPTPEAMYEKRPVVAEGYCGLAGKP